RPGARERVEPRRDHRVHAGAAGALQVSDVGGLRERAATEPVGQIAQARAARAVLEGPRSEDSLSARPPAVDLTLPVAHLDPFPALPDGKCWTNARPARPQTDASRRSTGRRLIHGDFISPSGISSATNMSVRPKNNMDGTGMSR